MYSKGAKHIKLKYFAIKKKIKKFRDILAY